MLGEITCHLVPKALESPTGQVTQGSGEGEMSQKC